MVENGRDRIQVNPAHPSGVVDQLFPMNAGEQPAAVQGQGALSSQQHLVGKPDIGEGLSHTVGHFFHAGRVAFHSCLVIL